MIRDFILTLVTLFVIEPFQAQFNEKMAAAQAPQAIVQDLMTCSRQATPAVVDRVMNDWSWAATTAVQLTIGTRTPDAVLAEVTPSCAPAIRAALPFVNGVRA